MNLKKSLALLIITGFLSGVTMAEKPAERMGDIYYRQFDFKKAIAFYGRVLKKDSSNIDVLQKIADSYRLLDDWKNAEIFYGDIVSADTTNANITDKLYYADALRANQKYAEAKIYYKQYLTANPDDNSVKERLDGIDKIEQLSQDHGLYELKDMPINSKYSDFGVSFFKDTGIFFCSNRFEETYVKHKDDWTHASFLQIYMAFKNKRDTTTAGSDTAGPITKAQLMHSEHGHWPDKKFHEGCSSYCDKMDELYFDGSNYKGKKWKRAGLSADKTDKLKIYRITWLPDRKTWEDAMSEALPGINNDEYSVCHPSLSKDGKTLYFASDKPGGYGGLDLYVCTRDIGGPWSVPVNLGPKVNTSGNDCFPFIADDGTLYFASDGHAGLGGLDVYSTTQVKTGNKISTWTEPENLGSPVNTSSDDFGYIIYKDNKTGYLCSNRPGGMGDDDIYSFVKKGITLNGIVYDANTGLPIADAEVTQKEDGVEKGKTKSDKDGNFTFPGIPGRKYTFDATHAGYLPAEIVYDAKEKPELIKIPMVQEGGISLEVTVIDKKTREPLEGAKVILTNLSTNKNESCAASKDGKCTFTLEPNTNYRIEASKETGEPDTKYLSVTATQSTIGKKAPATLYSVLELEKVKKGVAIKIENIYYDLDKWFIRPDAAKELDKLVKVLKDNPTLVIELSSHTDCRATAKYNQQLSSKRAEAAVNYIASQGIDPKRMIAAGYGESRLVNKCACEGTYVVPCTEEEHQENRRTEFKILKF